MARLGCGRAWIQFVGDATARLSVQRLSDRFRSAVNALPELIPAGADFSIHRARAAVARYSTPTQAAGYLRIGDAAVSMDPLSGNGVYEALGSAQVGVAAINTYLTGGAWSEIARFVNERAAELWRRSVAAAGSFYRLQSERAACPFWLAAASTYERLALGAKSDETGPGRFEMRPVLNHQRIEVRRVWVNEEWPRGIWMPVPPAFQQEV